MEENQNVSEIEDGPSCSGKDSQQIKDDRELRRKALKLDLAPLLGKVFRYVMVNEHGECQEVDEQFVRERRETFQQGSRSGASTSKLPMRKVRRARQLIRGSHKTSLEGDTGVASIRPEWLPDSFTVTRTTRTHVSGWVSSEEELTQVLSSHSSAFSCKFISWYQGRGLSNTIDSKRIAWKREDIEPGCPFAIDSYLVRHCPHGLKEKRLENVRDNYLEKETHEEDKDAICCHARLKIRRVTLYEDFRVSPEEKSKKIMLDKMLCVKRLLGQGQAVQTSTRIYLLLPLPAAHMNHIVPPNRAIDEMVKPEVQYEAGLEDDDCMKTLFGVDQSEISFDDAMSKIEVKEMDEVASQSMEGPFQVVTLPFGGDGDTNCHSWKPEEQSLFVHDANNVIPTDDSQAQEVRISREKENAEAKFEVQPRYKRTHILSSCKVDCPARIKVKRVTLYESFKVEAGDSRRKKDDKMLMLKDLISSGREDLQATNAIFMQLPLATAHRNHQVSIPINDYGHETTTNLGNGSVNGNTSQAPTHQHYQQYQHYPQYHSWLPSCFNVSSCGPEYITGWVRTEEDYLGVMEGHRHAFGCSFLSWSNDKERTFKSEADRRLMWKKDFVEPGCPLTVHHSLILACAYSNQSKGPVQTVTETDMVQADLSPLLVPQHTLTLPGESSNTQVSAGFVQDGTSLEIQYCDAADHYPELQSLIKSEETYIILVENS